MRKVLSAEARPADTVKFVFAHQKVSTQILFSARPKEGLCANFPGGPRIPQTVDWQNPAPLLQTPFHPQSLNIEMLTLSV
jgi:hypothetical protein